MNQKEYELLLSKLRLPIHVSYISDYILRVSEKETQKILDQLIIEGKIEESKLSKGYFVIKVNN